MDIETFPALELATLRHGFSTRSSQPLDGLEAELATTFRAIGFPMDAAVQGEQPHGNRIQVIDAPTPTRVPGVDALATSVPGLPLVVRVADCGPVFFYDPTQRVIAVAHSGRRGTEGNIVGGTITCLQKTFHCHPENLIIQLGPCIRPPHYEVDFAAEIGRQAQACGVRQYHDCGICTASHLDRYYSYRAERGKTGRMWAVMMLDFLSE